MECRNRARDSLNAALRRLAPLLAAALLSLLFAPASADEDADIVMACHYAIGEFGYEAINICIKEQQAARAAVKQFPGEAQGVVARCTRRWEPGWVMVKRCVDEDLAAAVALEDYAPEHDQKIDRCRERFGDRGDARVRTCVDQAIEAENAGTAR